MSNEFYSENNDFKKNICRFIDEWLKVHTDYSSAKLARELNLSDTSVKRWRNGVCVPDLSLLPKICEIMNVSILTLLGIENTSGLSAQEQNLLKTYQEGDFDF